MLWDDGFGRVSIGHKIRESIKRWKIKKDAGQNGPRVIGFDNESAHYSR